MKEVDDGGCWVSLEVSIRALFEARHVWWIRWRSRKYSDENCCLREEGMADGRCQYKRRAGV